ncbi:MAG: MBL fold metallo-hydrolase [Myxococcales bacterium]|nr:MBL fold metallo-hydrolase [Myxococcales bacterium]
MSTDATQQEPPVKVAIVPVTAFQQNCSVVRCERTGKGALIDPGGEVDRLLAAVEELDMELEKILLTHAHADHAGATGELVARLGVPVEGPHQGDQFLIDSIVQQSQMFGLAEVEQFSPTRFLVGGDKVQVGELEFDVLHCPGHTPGHVVFFLDAARLAFVGDVLFQGSIGRSDFPRGDHATLIRSIQDVLMPLGDDVTFLPGHGPPSTFGHERKTNPFLVGEA